MRRPCCRVISRAEIFAFEQISQKSSLESRQQKNYTVLCRRPNWHGLSRRLLAAPTAAQPAPIDRMLGTDDLHISRLALGIGLQGAPQGRDNLRWLRHILGVVALCP